MTSKLDEAIRAIDALLDECKRTGPLQYDLPKTEHANHALLRLHEIAGRNP